MKNDKIIYRGGSGEIVEKKSRFIAEAVPVRSEEEALAFLETVRKKYWDARHHCYAYIYGNDPVISRCGDDGEPSGTAGKPMLDVIAGEGLRDVCVVVTRYFGGTLLGTGGLARAYRDAAKKAVADCVILEKRKGLAFLVELDYNLVGKFQYFVEGSDAWLTGSEYTDKAVFHVVVETDRAEAWRRSAVETTAGKAWISPDGEREFAVYDGKVVFL